MTNKAKEKYVLGIHHSKIRYSPEKRGDGSSFIRYKARPNGSKNYISSSTYEGLIDKLYDYYAEKTLTLADVFTDALRWKAARNVSPKTIVEYHGTWERHIRHSHISSLPIHQIDPDVLTSFYDELVTKNHFSYRQLQDIRNVMSFILRYCLSRHLISHNPALDVDYSDFPYRSDSLNRGTIKRAAFPLHRLPDIIQWLLEELARPRINPLHPLGIMVGIFLACRYGELRGLIWNRIDFEKCTVMIEDQIVPCYGFDETDMSFIYLGHQSAGHIKGYETPSAIPIPAPALDALIKIKSLGLDDTYVFPAGHFRHGTLNNTIKRMAADLGMDASKYSSHSLRTTGATFLYVKTHDIYLVQRLLHHSSPEMTYRYIKDLNIDTKLNKVMLSDDFFELNTDKNSNDGNDSK